MSHTAVPAVQLDGVKVPVQQLYGFKVYGPREVHTTDGVVWSYTAIGPREDDGRRRSYMFRSRYRAVAWRKLIKIIRPF